MGLPPRKYFSEITLNLHTKNAIAVPPEELLSGKEVPEGAQEVFDLCHIYAICRRPRLSFDPEKFRYAEPLSVGILKRKVEGRDEEVPFVIAIRGPEGGRVEVGPYPHRKLLGFDASGDVVREWPASFVGMHARTANDSIRDFEVLYIGQAFGDGDRTAFDRLQSHKTLQKILANIHAESPDDEVLLFMFEYEPGVAMISMDGTTKDAKIIGNEDTEHMQNVLNSPPTEKEEISIAEAGLIWYFKPPYNVKFKDSHPKEDLKVLESCYRLDLAGLSVEINTDEFPCRIWSQVRPPGHHHIAQFDLHDPQLRRSFFSLVDDKGELTLIDTSGPVY